MTLTEANDQLATAKDAYEQAKRDNPKLPKPMIDHYEGRIRVALMRFDKVVDDIRSKVGTRVAATVGGGS